MGSFNTTCFISQQTISTDDCAVIFPISQQKTYRPVELSITQNGKTEQKSRYGYANSTCYPTAFWSFEGPMFTGKYYDYGQFNLDNTPQNTVNLKVFFNHLHQNLYDVAQGENSSHDLPIKFKELYNPKQEYSFEELREIWDSMWELNHEHRLFVKDYNDEPICLAFSVAHKSAVDYLINMVSSYKNWQNQSYNQFDVIQRQITQSLERISSFDSQKMKDFGSFHLLTKLANLEGISIGEQEGSYISNHYDCYEEIEKIVSEFLKNESNPKEIDQEFIQKSLEIVKPQLAHRYVLSGLTNLNIRLSPMVYASQDYQNEIGNAYLKMVQSVNQSVNLIVKEKYAE